VFYVTVFQGFQIRPVGTSRERATEGEGGRVTTLRGKGRGRSGLARVGTGWGGSEKERDRHMRLQPKS